MSDRTGGMVGAHRGLRRAAADASWLDVLNGNRAAAKHVGGQSAI
jgi:hypothetical protein